MKIYILRHEERTLDATMFSPLTKKGLSNAVNLSKILKEHNINLIYSSPYIRTLQTIYPFAKHINKKINIDYSLQEIQHPHIIPQKSYKVNLPIYIAESFNYNNKYKSIIEPENNKYPEDEKDVLTRTKKFLKKLMNENVKTKNNIVLVTHQAVCNSFLKVASKNMKNTKIEFIDKYPKGGLTEIWDSDEWVLNKINYT